MINSKSITAINESKFSKYFVKPLYDSYCFSNIPQTIKNALTGSTEDGLPKDVFGDLPQKYDKVVVFLVDAFGWRLFEKYNYLPLLKKIIDKGVVSKLTSQFPSTTASHITCLYTGLPVCRSGVYEWFYFEPELDSIIAPIAFSFTGKKEPEGLLKTGINPQKIYPRSTFFRLLKREGVNSYYFNSIGHVNSTYSQIVSRGAKIVPFRTLSEGLINLAHIVKHEKNKAFFSFYFEKIDSIGHRYDFDSPQVKAEVESFLNNLENYFFKNLQNGADNTLVIITADHGLAKIDPKKTIYLNKKFPQIKKYLKTNRQGQFLVPAGSPRDMFLYVKNEYLDEAKKFLEKKLAGKAEVYKTEDLICQGFFGIHKPSRAFLKRIGNLVILSYEGESVWWYEKGIFEVHHLSHHGGLTRNEMEIPLLLYSF